MRRLPTALGLLASTMLCGTGAAFAQDTPPATDDAQQQDDETNVIVTATRRAENLQDVPIAITALGTQTLDELRVDNFDDYARFVPSLSYGSLGPGSANVYFRGVASGENANHSASLPSVGTYLDEQPITTTTGALDLHIFDIARVEALAGPQGTLYGASSQAGTVRIITNQPDTNSFSGAANLELNNVAHGDFGGTFEGFVNAPLSSNVALRVVAWYRRDAGYIDNIPGTLNFPTSGIAFDNDDLVEEDYNDIDTYGARAALRIELGDRWTVTPSIMAQRQLVRGSFAQESGLGPLQVSQFNPERRNDRWYQAALTIQGRIGNWDLTYAGAWMQRQIDGQFDYSDYAYFYDALAGYGAYFYDNGGNLVNPNQYIRSDDSFRRLSQELRVTSPADRPVRLVGGIFYQRQQHNIEQNYIIDNIADVITVPGTASNIWLTQQRRVDRDYAIFGELAWDITPELTLTGGGRLYRFDNTLTGFFGFSDGYSGSTGVAACFGPPSVPQSPCQNLGDVDANGNIGPKRSEDEGFIHRLNLTYRITEDHLIYATWSRGFRPGGINRRQILPPYGADFISNYELGLKTDWLNHRLRFNMAIYQLDWDNFQFSFLGANGLTAIQNAGNARIRGLEFDFLARPIQGLSISLGGAFNDAETTDAVLAPAGTRLPLTARFKGNARIRYEFPVMGMDGHVQASASHEGTRTRDLRPAIIPIYGNLGSYQIVDLSAGVENDRWSITLFARNLFDERGAIGSGIQCNEFVCGDAGGQTAIGPKIYTYVSRPRTLGIRFGVEF